MYRTKFATEQATMNSPPPTLDNNLTGVCATVGDCLEKTWEALDDLLTTPLEELFSLYIAEIIPTVCSICQGNFIFPGGKVDF
jgi:hypothetical protein